MQSVNLNMIPGSVLPVINLTQYDEGRQFALVVYDGSTAADLSTAQILISGKKQDETAFSYGQSDTVKGNYVISVSGNTVTIRNTLQMAAAYGDVLATLTIKKSAADVSTLNFVIRVQEHPLDGVDISDTEIPGIIALAQAQADQAEAWATGEIGGVPVDPDAPQHENNAEYWALQAQIAAQGGLKWKGSCTFAQIPTTGMEVGDMWDITDAFTTDNRFAEGAGIQCKAGTNIAWDGSHWDLLATGSPIALPHGGIAGQFLVKQSSADQDADWGAGVYFFETVADAQAAVSGGTVPNGAIVMVKEIGGGVLVTPGLGDLSDVQLSTLANGNILIYDSVAGKWKNAMADDVLSTSSNNPVRNRAVANALAAGRITFGVNSYSSFGYKKDGADTIYPFFPGDPVMSMVYSAGLVFSFESDFTHVDNHFMLFGRLMILDLVVSTSIAAIASGSEILVATLNNVGKRPPTYGIYTVLGIAQAYGGVCKATIDEDGKIKIYGPLQISTGSSIDIRLVYLTNE